jgi:hypothetical protein
VRAHGGDVADVEVAQGVVSINFSTLVYLPNFDIWARPITVTPLASQPAGAAYSARGIFDTEATDVLAEDGSIISQQKTILDIREVEFAVLPQQGDQIDIPDAEQGPGGSFEVTDSSSNGGGETTLTIRKVVTAVP